MLIYHHLILRLLSNKQTLNQIIVDLKRRHKIIKMKVKNKLSHRLQFNNQITIMLIFTLGKIQNKIIQLELDLKIKTLINPKLNQVNQSIPKIKIQ